MRHPEAILVPLLMVADYYLTLRGASLRQRKYAAHFAIEHYELNPKLQQAIAQRKRFSLRHAAITLVVTAAVVWLGEFAPGMPDELMNGLLGCLIVMYGTLAGGHLSNLLVFRYVERRPGELSGQVILGHRLALSLTAYNGLMAMVPMALVAAITRGAFAVGGAVGVAFLMIAILKWRRRHDANPPVLAEAEEAQNEGPVSATPPSQSSSSQ